MNWVYINPHPGLGLISLSPKNMEIMGGFRPDRTYINYLVTVTGFW